MADMKALKVKIGLKTNGNADYPDFNTLQSVKDSGMDWAYYIANPQFGFDWQYDKKYGHRDIGPDSPAGMQWGVILVNKTFADEAVAAFPTVCQEITDAEMKTFYEDRVTVNEPTELIDQTALSGLKEELALKEAVTQDTTAVKAKIAKALDPNDPEPGVKKNDVKTWAEKKAKDNIVIKAVAKVG